MEEGAALFREAEGEGGGVVFVYKRDIRVEGVIKIIFTPLRNGFCIYISSKRCVTFFDNLVVAFNNNRFILAFKVNNLGFVGGR